MKEDAASILRVMNFTRLLASPRGFVEFESWRQLTGAHPPPRCSEQSQQPNGRSGRGCGWRQPISLNRRVNDTRSRGYWRLLISPSGVGDVVRSTLSRTSNFKRSTSSTLKERIFDNYPGTMSKILFSTIEVTRQVFYRTSLTAAIVNLKPIVPGRT